MTFDEWFIEQFRNRLGETLRTTDGIPDVEIDSLLGNKAFPNSMRAYYRVAGRHWLNTIHNELRTLDALETIESHTVFMDENQGVVQWAIRNSELAADDPIVYQLQRTGSDIEWYAEKFTFSRFVIAMWQWILAAEDSD